MLCSPAGTNRFMQVDTAKNLPGSYYRIHKPETQVSQGCPARHIYLTTSYSHCASGWDGLRAALLAAQPMASLVPGMPCAVWWLFERPAVRPAMRCVDTGQGADFLHCP